MAISKPWCLAGVLLLGLVAGVDRVGAAEGPALALAALSKLKATKMGVDHLGNLWAWNNTDGGLRFLSRHGDLDSRYTVPQASAVDADADWGVVGLFDSGRLLRWMRGKGQPDVDIRLSDSASDLAWIALDSVAVAPQTAAHRIELWNLRERKLTRTLGQETPIRPTVGATRLRSVVVRYDFEREIFYSLDSFTGELQVYKRNGELAWRARVDNPDREKLEPWLRDMDASAKAQRTVETPVFFSLFLAPAADGSAWVTQRHDPSTGTITLVRVSPRGSPTTTTLRGEPCASRTFVIWGDRMIFHVDPAAPRDGCSNSRKLP